MAKETDAVSKATITALLNHQTALTAGRKKEAFKGAVSADLYRVDPRTIRIQANYNPRIPTKSYQAGIEELAQSMLAHGYHADKPLGVYVASVDGEDVLFLEDGHRRHAAVLRAIELGAPITAVPVVPKDRSANDLDRTYGLAQANEHTRFTPAEYAILAKRAKAMGESDEAIAVGLNITRAYVGQLLSLAGAPMVIWNWVVNEKISATHAIETLRKHKDKAVEVLQEQLARAEEKAKGKPKKEKAKGSDDVGEGEGDGDENRVRASSKDDPQAKKLSAMKRHGPALFGLVSELLKNKKVVEAMDEADYKNIDSLLFKVMGAEDTAPVAKA